MKKEYVVIIAVVAIVLVSLFLWPTITGNVSRQNYTCEDSDEGDLEGIYTPGIVTMKSLTGRTDIVYEDHCEGKYRVREYSCERDYARSNMYRCDLGEDSTGLCENGACVRE